MNYFNLQPGVKPSIKTVPSKNKKQTSSNMYPCPCCGYLTFKELPGSYLICPICFWEDDISQLRFVLEKGGANTVSLFEAQKNFQNFGCSDKKHLQYIRKLTTNDKRDPHWCLIDLSKDNIETPIGEIDYGKTYPKDLTKLYYWRDTFWRNKK